TQTDDLITRGDEALMQHPEIEAWPVMRDEQRGHRGFAEPDADAVARHAWLGDLEDRLADLVAIADAARVVGQPVDREVLAELAVREVAAPEFALPVPVGLDLVNEHGAMLAAVRGSVGLVVPVDVDLANHPRTIDGLLPDCRANRLALPLDVPG